MTIGVEIGLRNLVEDLTPVLGGSLDIGIHEVQGSGNFTTTGTGRFDGGVGVGVAPSSEVGYRTTLTTNTIHGACYGVRNVITSSGVGAYNYGVHTNISSSETAQSVGVHNTITTSGSGHGMFSAVSLTSGEGNVSGAKSFISTPSGTGYGFWYEINCASSGGNQYAFFADADWDGPVLDNFYAFYAKGALVSVNTSKWGVYIEDLNSYFGGQVVVKKLIPNVQTEASSATPTPNGDSYDQYQLTALAEAATFAAPSGTPVNGQKLTIRILDNGTGRALSWNAIYRVIGTTLPVTTTASKTIYIGLIYNTADTKWDVVAVAEEA